MKVIQINSVCGEGSTGKICMGISSIMNSQGIENYILYSLKNTNYSNAIKCSEFMPKIQSLFSRVIGNYGFNSKRTTRNLIKQLELIKPDVVHLHNLHSHNCNLSTLLKYLRDRKIPIVWTFHDCWAFTAYCPHYVMAKCDKWQKECYGCTQYKAFSWFIDRSRWLYKKKRDAARGLKLTIVTPSRWLANQVEMSFFREYPVKVIHNGIDLTIFKPTQSDFRRKHNIALDKFLILGVAIQWVPRKGADVFIELAKRLESDKYQIVLVGTDETIEKILPSSVIAIRRTESQKELAEIYTVADLFVNPTREEVFGLVNVEANACGTPVLTFNTGGSPECINELSGSVVGCEDVDSMEAEIRRIYSTRPYSSENCINRASVFSEISKYKEYIELYKRILKSEC